MLDRHRFAHVFWETLRDAPPPDFDAFALLLNALLPLVARGDSPAAKRSVTIYRDTWGVPIFTQNGGGWCLRPRLRSSPGPARRHLYRVPHGPGAAVRGVRQGQGTPGARLHHEVFQNEERAKEYWEKSPQHIKDITGSFAAGIQRYVDEHPEKVRRSPSRSSRGTSSPSVGQ